MFISRKFIQLRKLVKIDRCPKKVRRFIHLPIESFQKMFGSRPWIFLSLIFLFLGANGQPIDCCSNGKNPFDLTFDPDTVAVCFPIQIPINDAFYKGKKTCMNFARSETAPDMDCQPGPLQQVNQISHWLDGSNIYGSSR